MKHRLSNFETRLEHLVERLFGGHIDSQILVRAITVTFKDSEAPSHLLLRLHPLDYDVLAEDTPDLSRTIQNSLVEYARQQDIVLSAPPEIELEANPDQDRYTIGVEASYANRGRRPTGLTPPVAKGSAIFPPDAQLVRDGKVIFVLDQPAINIGRHFENHLVLDDTKISRWHCQLRLRSGSYILYDLNSTHGTFVGDVQIAEHTLMNGDIIRLGDITLMYVEDDSTEELHRSKGDTQLNRPHNEE